MCDVRVISPPRCSIPRRRARYISTSTCQVDATLYSVCVPTCRRPEARLKTFLMLGKFHSAEKTFWKLGPSIRSVSSAALLNWLPKGTSRRASMIWHLTALASSPPRHSGSSLESEASQDRYGKTTRVPSTVSSLSPLHRSQLFPRNFRRVFRGAVRAFLGLYSTSK